MVEGSRDVFLFFSEDFFFGDFFFFFFNGFFFGDFLLGEWGSFGIFLILLALLKG